LLEKCKTCKKRFTKEDSDAMRNDAAVKVRGEIPRTGIQGFLKFLACPFGFSQRCKSHRRMNKNSRGPVDESTNFASSEKSEARANR